MNILRKAIDDIKATIPIEVLRMAYEEDYYQSGWFKNNGRSLDDLILEQTLRARVIVDTNIVGGDEVIIPALSIPGKHVDDQNILYEIPADLVGFRTIMSVLSADYFISGTQPVSHYNSVASTVPNYGSELSMSGHKAMDSRSSIPIISTHEAVVVGHNNILVRNHMRGARIQQFRVVVANDKDLQNIHFRSALSFSKLCRYAVKSYIYTKLQIKLDRGFADRGHEIGAIKNYVESCSDAEENYQNYLEEVWQGVTTFNNQLGYHDLLKMQIDPSI